jgi:hypothetical protein
MSQQGNLHWYNPQNLFRFLQFTWTHVFVCACESVCMHVFAHVFFCSYVTLEIHETPPWWRFRAVPSHVLCAITYDYSSLLSLLLLWQVLICSLSLQFYYLKNITLLGIVLTALGRLRPEEFKFYASWGYLVISRPN